MSLFSVGSIGLIKAVNTYSLDKGTQLATYASRCIENEILMLIRSNKKHKNTVSLNTPVGTDKEGNEMCLSDMLSSDKNLINEVENNIILEHLVAIMQEVLSPKEFRIISLRYPLNDKGLTQKEVAKIFGISRSYISRIEKKALEKVKNAIKEEDLYID